MMRLRSRYKTGSHERAHCDSNKKDGCVRCHKRSRLGKNVFSYGGGYFVSSHDNRISSSNCQICNKLLRLVMKTIDIQCSFRY